MDKAQTYTAFEGVSRLSHGELENVVLDVKRRLKADSKASILVFSDSTGKQMDFDLRGSEKTVLERLKVYFPRHEASGATPTGPGRPRLGVVAREISLLPRHWEWLSNQPGGASATIRRLIDETRKSTSEREQVREAQECIHKFMSAIAGNLPDFEEALRALYARDKARFKKLITRWPHDIKEYINKGTEVIWRKP